MDFQEFILYLPNLLYFISIIFISYQIQITISIFFVIHLQFCQLFR